jgi:hypothetical protein
MSRELWKGQEIGSVGAGPWVSKTPASTATPTNAQWGIIGDPVSTDAGGFSEKVKTTDWDSPSLQGQSFWRTGHVVSGACLVFAG